MKTTKNLAELFELAKLEARKVPVGEIQSLIGSAKASPLASKPSFQPRRITRLFNPFKILIMITTIGIITAAYLLLNPGTGQVQTGGRPDIRESKISITTSEVENEKQEAVRIAGSSLQDQVNTLPSVPLKETMMAPQSVVKDTVLTGIILDLSKEELTRLGFMFDDEGYYYLNKLPDGSKMNCWSWHIRQDRSQSIPVGLLGNAVITSGGGSIGWGSGGYVNKENRSPLHEFDFYPVLTTDVTGENPNPIEQVAAQVRTSFELMNDTLVPVRFSQRTLGGYDTEDKLIWFKVSASFFDLLGTEPGEQSRLIYSSAKASDDQHPGQNHVVYQYPSLFPMDHAIRLTPDVLRCMGINYSPTSMDITIRAVEYWFKMEVNNVDGGTSITWSPTKVDPVGSPIDTLLPTTESIILMGISNFGGIKIIDMPTRVYRQLNRKDLNFQQFLSLCIPVLVDEGKVSATEKEVVFWIYPNERFFSCLPADIAEPMMKEFAFQKKQMDPDFLPRMGGSIGIKGGGLVKDTVRMGGSVGISGAEILKDSGMDDTEPVPCVYFTNLCESLPGLDYINLYPNPVADKLNVDLMIQKAMKIRYRVFDLGGRMVYDGVTPEEYSEGGQFKHQLDVSRLQPGFYLLVLTDTEGAKLTRRFVKN